MCIRDLGINVFPRFIALSRNLSREYMCVDKTQRISGTCALIYTGISVIARAICPHLCVPSNRSGVCPLLHHFLPDLCYTWKALEILGNTWAFLKDEEKFSRLKHLSFPGCPCAFSGNVSLMLCRCTSGVWENEFCETIFAPLRW